MYIGLHSTSKHFMSEKYYCTCLTPIIFILEMRMIIEEAEIFGKFMETSVETPRVRTTIKAAASA